MANLQRMFVVRCGRCSRGPWYVLAPREEHYDCAVCGEAMIVREHREAPTVHRDAHANVYHCDLCNNTGYAVFPDPFMKDGSLLEGRCPACQDTTVRAPKRLTRASAEERHERR